MEAQLPARGEPAMMAPMVRLWSPALCVLPVALATEVARAAEPPPPKAEIPVEANAPASTPTPTPLPAHWLANKDAEPKPTEADAEASAPARAPPRARGSVTPAPPKTPPPSSPTTLDSGTSDQAQSAGLRLAVEPLIGFSARLGAAALDFSTEETAGAVYGVNVGITPNRRYSLGLSYDRSLLGAGRTNQGADTVSVEYGANTLFAWTRAFPWRDGRTGLYVGLRIGLSWQDLDANGSRATNEPSRPVEIFQCAAADSPSLAMAAALGMEMSIERHVGFIAEAAATGYQASSAVIDGCAPGIGSTTAVGARLALQVLFGVGDG